MEAELADFVAHALSPARVAPPTIDFEPRVAHVADAVLIATPLRPEDAAWNAWPGPTSRLFNNRAALLFEVRLEPSHPIAVSPAAARVFLGPADEAGLPAAPSPDVLLLPLLRAALVEARWGLRGDLVERTRSAGAFREVWLPSGPLTSPTTGVIAFPLPDPERHMTSVRLELELVDRSGPHRAVWTWD